MKLSFQKTFYLLASSIAFVFILIIGKTVLFPLALALLIAFILLPISRKLEAAGMGRIVATTSTLLGISVLLGALVFFFSSYMIDALSSFGQLQNDLGVLFSRSVIWVNEHIPLLPDVTKDEALDGLRSKFMDTSGKFLGSSLSNTSAVFTGGLSTFIFTFFFLIYRRGLTQSLVAFFAKEHQGRMLQMFSDMQKVGQKYVEGMAKLMLLLGILNSLGLLIIGIENPFLFGFLAASLSVIPYVGTTLGAIIPTLFALVTYDSSWMPIAVLGWFGFVQFLEGNFLSPVIVGSSLDINALVAFLGLLIGAAIWGVGGMIIFLPYIAMLKVVSLQFEKLKPLSHLLSDKPYGDFKNDKKPLLERWKDWFHKGK